MGGVQKVCTQIPGVTMGNDREEKRNRGGAVGMDRAVGMLSLRAVGRLREWDNSEMGCGSLEGEVRT